MAISTTPTVDDYRTVFPEFNKVEDTIVEFYMELFTKLYSQKFFGPLWSYACYLYVSHNLYCRSEMVSYDEDGNPTPSEEAGVTGSVASRSQKIGDVSDATTYATSSASTSDSDLSSTKYGELLLSLIKRISMGISAVTSSHQQSFFPGYPTEVKKHA